MKAVAIYIGKMEFEEITLHLFNLLIPVYNKTQDLTHPINSTVSLKTIQENIKIEEGFNFEVGKFIYAAT
jgi:ornithine carbamoyltransferase